MTSTLCITQRVVTNDEMGFRILVRLTVHGTSAESMYWMQGLKDSVASSTRQGVYAQCGLDGPRWGLDARLDPTTLANRDDMTTASECLDDLSENLLWRILAEFIEKQGWQAVSTNRTESRDGSSRTVHREIWLQRPHESSS